ncbi:MAG TPA: alpha-L-fucosidase, partial [Candidatus Paceibacterota bacterium]|nr:alpha-L-fucosidase [Candidatus Paceibacterota bacterium]
PHYRCPDWFRDAKLGIWAHWGPQSAPECGDWYARNLYIQGCRQNRFHLEHFGHPSKFGYKDIIPTWKGDLFDPDHLLGLYRKAGAKYFVSMGVHVDNFDLWNSKHTRWNAVNMGIKKDVVGLFRKAARRHGLKFGVSDHLWMAYKWMSVAHGSDRDGPLAGVPYDGANPNYAELYGDCPKTYRELPWDEDDIPEKWKRHWSDRIKDLVDQHQPDLLYCDGQIPFGTIGRDLVTHFYAENAKRHGGAVQAVYTSKRREDSEAGLCVFDKERGVVDGIWPEPWQIDTCIGKWHYDREANYKSPKRIIDMLVDVVSRNGNLLLNFPLNNRGMLDAAEQEILSHLTNWMSVNQEAIHGTRPWKIFGDGRDQVKNDPKEKYNENSRTDFTNADVRFTTKGKTLYAFFMGWPEKAVVIPALATSHPHVTGRIQSVRLLGARDRLRWKHDEAGLTVQPPPQKPCDHACALAIEGLDT